MRQHRRQMTTRRSLKQTLQPLADLSQEAVDRRLEELGIEGQAFAFLRACLQVKPMKRKSIHELKSKGWITGNTATQMHREGMGDMRDIRDGVRRVEHKVDQVAQRVTDVLERVEAVRKTILSIGDAETPYLFTVVPEEIPEPDETESKSRFARMKQLAPEPEDYVGQGQECPCSREAAALLAVPVHVRACRRRL